MILFNPIKKYSDVLKKENSYNHVLDYIEMLKDTDIQNYAREIDANISIFESKSDIKEYTFEKIKNAEKSILIKAGDFDHISEKTASSEDGIIGQDWLDIYQSAVEKLGSENVTFVMHIEGWTEKTAKEVLDTGANLRHNISDFHGGIIDNEAFYFDKTKIDDNYTKTVGTPQRQLDKMIYRGWATELTPFVKQINSALKDILKESEPASEKLERIYKLQKESVIVN